MGPDDFERFLESLSPDAEEAGRRYVQIHERLVGYFKRRLVGFFNMTGIFDPASAADETVERAAHRINRGAKVPNVERYCLGVARYIAKEKRRGGLREYKAVEQFMADLAKDSIEQVERIQHVLKPCFEQLEDEDRELLEVYCRIPEGQSAAEHRRRLAEKMGITVGALRIRVSRLRDRLDDCTRESSQNS